MAIRETAAAVLDVAEVLVQTRGYHAFSYRDLAERVGIKAASIHYHFPSKGDLCRALIARYRVRFNAALADIDEQEDDPSRKLDRYAQLFHDTLTAGNRMCPCGMLAADFETLPEAVREEVRGYFEDNTAWLSRVLDEARESGRVRFDGPAEAEARLIVSALEGFMLVARLYTDPALFEAMTRRLFTRC